MSKRKSFFPVLLLVTTLMLLILLCSIAFTYLTGVFDSSGTFADQFLNMNLSAYWPIAQYLLSLILLYLLYAIIVYYFTRWLVGDKRSVKMLSVMIYVLGYLCIIVLNSHLYPHSLFAYAWFAPWNHNSGQNIIFWISAAVLALLFVGALLGFSKSLNGKAGKLVFWLFVVVGLGSYGYCVASYYYRFSLRQPPQNVKVSKQPTIILLSFCSLRQDYMKDYPHFNAFIKHASSFSDAYTPVARSASALFAMLTSQYPANSHFFINRNWMDPGIDYSKTLPHDLQRLGYRSVFISNGTMFRHLNPQFRWGFDQVVVPREDLYVFILPRLNDTPLTNLFMNLPLFSELFPYNYAHARDAVHYYPNTFLHRVQRTLQSDAGDKPLLLVLDDETLHFPYRIANTPPLTGKNRYRWLYNIADNDFGFYLDKLKRYHLLDNAIVILLADHGESFGKITGHGGNVNALEQYNVPLVFRFYGSNKNIKTPRQIDGLASTLDIKPTLLDFLEADIGKVDGISLLPYLRGKAMPNDRTLFMQSGVDVKLPATLGDEKQLAYQMQRFFHLTPKGEVGYKLSFINKMRHKINSAALWKHYQMTYYAKSKSPLNHYRLINIETKKGVTYRPGETASLPQIDISPEQAMSLYDHLEDYVQKALKD